MLLKLFRSNTQLALLDNVVFFRQLNTLMTAGVPIIESLTLMTHHQVAFHPIVVNLRQALLNGSTFHQAMLSCNFQPWICELIKLGEHTGKLTEVMASIANHLEHHWQLKKRILSIIFYPGIILLFALFISIFLLVIVVPQFQIMFKEAKVELPFLTRCIFASASCLTALGLPFLLILVGMMFLLIGRVNIIASLKKLPLLKPFLLKTQLATWSHQLALALVAGLPITKALELVDPLDEASRVIYHKVRQQLMLGEALNQAMLNTQYFPLLMIQMIKIGENSGQLEVMLNKIGDIFRNEAEQSLRLFCQILDPLIMVSLGVLIGGLLIGIYLPIFTLGTTL